MRAYELPATIAANGQLVLPNFHLDSELQDAQVRVIILVEEKDDIRDDDWLKSAAHNPALDFLHDPEEDIYTSHDGKPFEYKG